MNRRLRWVSAGFVVVALTLSALSASAQDDATKRDRARQFQAALQKRFAAADSNGDGRLSRDEAKAKMPRVYEHFDEIDTAHAGSIGLADIEAWLVKARESRKASAP